MELGRIVLTKCYVHSIEAISKCVDTAINRESPREEGSLSGGVKRSERQGVAVVVSPWFDMLRSAHHAKHSPW